LFFKLACAFTWLCLPSPWFAIVLVSFTIYLAHHCFNYICRFVWFGLQNCYHHSYQSISKLLPWLLPIDFKATTISIFLGTLVV
jgi:hypothetical protein